METPRLISYIRVSTRGQSESGLGMEAQRAAVARYAQATGATILAEYCEVETGKDPGRPVLADALRHARLARATLVIAKLDRLARNVHFLSGLMEGDVDFVALDVPSASRLTLHILAAVAEEEARAISQRTTAALAACKARGVGLGTNGRDRHGTLIRDLIPMETLLSNVKAATAGKIRAAREAYREIRPIIVGLHRRGMSIRKIAAELNSRGYVTRRNRTWNAMQVSRVLNQPQADKEAS